MWRRGRGLALLLLVKVGSRGLGRLASDLRSPQNGQLLPFREVYIDFNLVCQNCHEGNALFLISWRRLGKSSSSQEFNEPQG